MLAVKKPDKEISIFLMAHLLNSYCSIPSNLYVKDTLFWTNAKIWQIVIAASYPSVQWRFLNEAYMTFYHWIGQMLISLHEGVYLLQFSEHRWRFYQFYNNFGLLYHRHRALIWELSSALKTAGPTQKVPKQAQWIGLWIFKRVFLKIFFPTWIGGRQKLIHYIRMIFDILWMF